MEPLFLGLRHVALNVRDVQKALEFYSKVLGMKLEWMPDEDNAYLTSGQDNLALHKLPSGAEPGRVQTVHHIGLWSSAPRMLTNGLNGLEGMEFRWPRNLKPTGTGPALFTSMIRMAF